MSDSLGRELCQAFISAGIPWKALENPALHTFLEQNIGISIPLEATLRNKYLNEIYIEAKRTIKNALDGKPLVLQVDETTDVENRHVANVLMSSLDVIIKKGLWYTTTFLEKNNHSTIAQLVNDTINELFLTFNKSLFKVYITDQAPYAIKSGKDLQVLYPDLKHISCVAHAHHRICEDIREIFKCTDNFIAAVKQVFKNSPSRISVWKQVNPQLQVPPEPGVTHWGT
ncbi:hypothetical protein TCAL_07492 [Tigriopus californicus]|uniref:DUF659 domain-containing protein n=1 Tax=Tigriopus californicus TaxID=6832 RepID=A0A553PT05_TIGCA|nr:hypothetical protein TCAL_07492 [Tigriopus californicus]|eukprot:TCALIF_07492-PA protein Name:"Protein of unknown function" AED:0.22 eAED:0.22 QI:0/-1/0/1/-1/1/1/0/227